MHLYFLKQLLSCYRYDRIFSIKNWSCKFMSLKHHKNDKNIHKNDSVIWYVVILIKDQFIICNIRFGILVLS